MLIEDSIDLSMGVLLHKRDIFVSLSGIHMIFFDSDSDLSIRIITNRPSVCVSLFFPFFVFFFVFSSNVRSIVIEVDVEEI